MNCMKLLNEPAANSGAKACHMMVVFALLACLPTMAGAEDRPNFVLIFADDQGWKDVGYQSDGKFLTPNIDGLARDGMVFTDAYAASGNCAPSRFARPGLARRRSRG